MRSYGEGPFELNNKDAFKRIDVNTGGQFSSVAVEIFGTPTAGGMYLKGGLQGPNPVQLYTEEVSTGTSIGDGKITKPGVYRVASAALMHVFLEPSEDYVANPSDPVSAYFCISESLPPISIVGSI